MSTIWKNWCRLCARHDGSEYDEFFKLDTIMELSELVQKYFLITLSPYDESPTAICNDCVKFVLGLEKFAVRCTKVDKMYSELVYDNINILEDEIHSVRYKYGLDEEQKFSEAAVGNGRFNRSLLAQQLKVDQSTDTADLLPMHQSVFHARIKEEETTHVVEVSPGSVKRTRRTRRSRKQAHLPMEYAQLPTKVESENEVTYMDGVVRDSGYVENDMENGDAIDQRDDDDDDDEDENENDDVDDEDEDVSYEQELDPTELQEELDDLNDVDYRTVPKKRARKNKRSADAASTTESITCTLCDRDFDRPRQYEYHMRTKHSAADLPFVCTKCPKRFTTEKKVKLHEAVHLPEQLKMIHPCPYCDKKFSKAVNVQAHVRAIHIGDRPFICEECGKSFGTKGALKEHQITHSEERPYQCPHCPKKFKNLPRLKTHEDIHNETTYVCPHCGLQLNTKRTLKMHMVVHSDQKKYKCQYCGNEYKRSKALKNHLILHTGLRPYMCPFCDKTFANGSNCRSHKKKSHPQELAAMEASGEVQRATNIPKLEHLQPKANQMQQIQEMVDSVQNAANTPPMQLDGLTGAPLKSEVPSLTIDTTTPDTSPHGMSSIGSQHNGLASHHHHQHQHQLQPPESHQSISLMSPNVIGQQSDHSDMIMHLHDDDGMRPAQSTSVPLIPTSNL